MANVVDSRIKHKSLKASVGDLIIFNNDERDFVCYLRGKYSLILALRFTATTDRYDSVDELVEKLIDMNKIKEIIPADKPQITIVD